MSDEPKAEILQDLLSELKDCLENDVPVSQEFYDNIQMHPELGIQLLTRIPKLDTNKRDDEESLIIYLHFIELCLTLLRITSEHEQRFAIKTIELYQQKLCELMKTYPSLSHWMSVMNVFYNADINLTEEIKRLYLYTIKNMGPAEKEPLTQKQLLTHILSKENDSNEFDITEMFFSQTSALPQEYFPAFVKELLAFEQPKATNAAVLFLMHPEKKIRSLLFEHIEELFADYDLTPASLSRLPVIRQWLPEEERGAIDYLLSIERRKGGTFQTVKPHKITEIKASEMSGLGSQAIFISLKSKGLYQTAGILTKRDFGIKDSWLTAPTKEKSKRDFSLKAMYQSVTLRKVDINYVRLLLTHHIYFGQQTGFVPKIRLLQIAELCDLKLRPDPLHIEQELKHLLEQAGELDDLWQQQSLKRSAKWHKTQSFVDAWIDESQELDRLVNSHCSFVDGAKYCDMTNAREDVLTQHMENHRPQWLLHFLWLTLWAKPHARHNEYLWKDSLVLALQIQKGIPMNEIPLMQMVAEINIIASLETMEVRKTHLS